MPEFVFRIEGRPSGKVFREMSDGNVFCELSEDGKRIEVYFRYSPDDVEAIKRVAGKRFVGKDKTSNPHWTIPKDMISARQLREEFGERLVLGDAVREWGREARSVQRNLDRMSLAEDADLPVVKAKNPELWEYLHPYQRADAAFMAAGAPLNANEPGLGKTVEVIASMIEQGADEGPSLIIAPATSLETVWEAELTRWMPEGYEVFLLSGDYKLSKDDIEDLTEMFLYGSPLALVTTAAQVRRGLPNGLELGTDMSQDRPPAERPWKRLVLDEFHKTGATNINGDPTKGTQFGRALRGIPRELTTFVSGTPTGGRPIRLWGVLNHAKPEVFSSKWRWAEEWLVVEEEDFYIRGGGGAKQKTKKITNQVKPDKVDLFYPEHAQFIVRRLKSDVAPWLPPKQRIDVVTPMLAKQAKQYQAMEKDAELNIDGARMSATGILAEYTRLRQFANAECKIVDGKLIPVASNKLLALIEKLDERGIRPSKDGMEPEGDQQAIVASQSKEMIYWVHEKLTDFGIKCEVITGDTPQKARAEIQRRFQKGDSTAPRVVLITTTAGGVAITLDRADSVHLLDETWDPDDDTQVEDRAHRISRNHQVDCYYYRSKGTIDDVIRVVTEGKEFTGAMVLDRLREAHKTKETAGENGA